MLTVEEARERRVCRICEQPIQVTGPAGWPVEFGRMVYPVAVTLNFGDEFAHTACLEQERVLKRLSAKPETLDTLRERLESDDVTG